MKRLHFETFRPVCPSCIRAAAGTELSPLKLQSVFEVVQDDVRQGILACPQQSCGREFPIIDGIPVIVSDLANVMNSNLWQLLLRPDLAEPLESLIGDACGPGSSFDLTRQHLSAYAWDHYGEFDPAENSDSFRPGNVASLVAAGIGVCEESGSGAMLDLGCATGRSTFELANRCPGALVIGIDLTVSMLRLAAGILHEGVVRYPRRRNGLVYDRRQFPVDFAAADRVDFWACDAAVLPFADRTIGLIQSLNLLDCLPAPGAALHEWTRVLADESHAWITTPFDWNSAATPLENWIGGHSQRQAAAGDGVTMLKAMCGLNAPGNSGSRLRLIREFPHLTWRVRCHERSVMEYSTYGVLLKVGNGKKPTHGMMSGLPETQ